MTHLIPFHAHTALALQLLSLVAGCFLLAKAAKGEFPYPKLGKLLGGLVVIVSLLSALCIAFLSIQNYSHQREARLEEKMWQHPPIDWSKHPMEMDKKD